MRSFKDLIFWFFKLVFPFYLLFIIKLMIIGSIYQWGPAEKEFSQYHSETPILVGFSFSLKASGSYSHHRLSMEYILWPSVLNDYKSTVISKADSLKPEIRIRLFGFVIKLFWVFVCIIGTWFFWSGYKRTLKWAKSNL